MSVYQKVGFKIKMKNKSDGYSLKDGKKSTKTIDLLVNSGRIPKKNWLRIDIRKVPSQFIQR